MTGPFRDRRRSLLCAPDRFAIRPWPWSLRPRLGGLVAPNGRVLAMDGGQLIPCLEVA